MSELQICIKGSCKLFDTKDLEGKDINQIIEEHFPDSKEEIIEEPKEENGDKL